VVVIVDVAVDHEEGPPAGAPVRVEARDTTYLDQAAPVLAEAAGVVERSGSRLCTVELQLAPIPGDCSIWAHVDVDGDGRVSPGDFVTTASYPVVDGDETRLQVIVRRV
jgi:hypothetical protein